MAQDKKNTSEERQLTPEERQQALVRANDTMEAIIAECGVTALKDLPPLMQSVKLADGIHQLRSTMSKSMVERFFMPLQGTPLGFVTDKDKEGGYPVEVVRDVVIEALLRGFRPIGNEFNIIAGRFYGAKAGFERIVREFPGVSDLQFDIGVPHMVAEKGALVPFVATWFYLGEEQTLEGREVGEGNRIDTRIAVKVNSGMGPDAILGKATRKMFARIYQRLTGCSRDVVELDPVEYVDAKARVDNQVTSVPQGRRMSLNSTQQLFVEAAEREFEDEREPVED